MTDYEALRAERENEALACADLVHLKLWDFAALRAARVKQLDDAIMDHFREIKRQYESPAQDMPPR
jgi:hypothetical protein